MNSIIFNGQEVYPSKIVCIGRNYVAHIEELNNEIPLEPVVFIKPNSSISDEIEFDPNDIIHYEGEIVFLIMDGEIKGVGFGLDLTKRVLQSQLKSKGLPWERAKAFDKSGVFSKFITYDGDLNNLIMELHVNNQLVQVGDCKLMLNKPNKLLAEVKTFLSLEDGDLLMSGTPSGVGPIHCNDELHGKIFSDDKLLIEKYWIVK